MESPYIRIKCDVNMYSEICLIRQARVGGANLPPVGIEVFKKIHTFLQRVIL